MVGSGAQSGRAEGHAALARLRQERERTEAEIASLSESFDDIVDGSALVSTDDEHDPEGATIAFERQQIAALLGEARRRLGDVDDAMERVHSGGYGVCGECGGPIGEQRLEARPEARHCVTCAARFS